MHDSFGVGWSFAMTILVSGSLAYDRIMDFSENFADHILPDKIHILNVCFMVNGVKEQFGGTAGNIAYNLRLLGEKPLILACAGKDFGEYSRWLESLGLSLEGIRIIEDELTAGAYITTDRSDNQITGFNPGAMRHPCGYTVDGLDPRRTLAIIAPGNLQDMVDFAAIYKQKGIPYICDPGQSIPALSKEDLLHMITGSRVFISNDYELEMVMRITGENKDQLLRRTNAVVTTLGEKGCVVTTHEDQCAIPAVRVSKAVDPTGAGDAFRAGFIKGLRAGRDFVDSCKMGVVSASFGVECQGTQCHRFTLEDFWDRYAAHFGRVGGE
jgi:adenosine kinase